MTVHIYTSITANYIPKARVLAHSVKRCRPDSLFHLVLNDRLGEPLDLSAEPFDHVITLEDLSIPLVRGWTFKHSVVELCTAVKGVALLHLIRSVGAKKVFYFDPDIAVFGRLDELSAHLDSASILLTPHLAQPEDSLEAVLDNEVAALKHGVFNLGFLGVRASETGTAFAQWWSDRLLQLCYDEPERGLFTDQRWADLIPCFFPDHRILQSPAFNVATWNLTHRRAEGNLETGVLINGEPLGFYHFSGLDSGAQHQMLDKYGGEQEVLYRLREWYLDACERNGQRDWGSRPCAYSVFDDGVPIAREHRILYRHRPDLQASFPDPYRTVGDTLSYRSWFERADADSRAGMRPQEEIAQLRAELAAIKGSTTWRFGRQIARLLGRGR